MARKVAEAAQAVQRLAAGAQPEAAIVLETHMGGFSNELGRLAVAPFRSIPQFPDAVPPARGGSLLIGTLGDRPVAVLEGRAHLHEGHLPGETAFSVRLLAALGVRKVMLVADGRPLREDLNPGVMFLLTDRLDLTGVTPLKGVPRSQERAGMEPARDLGAAAAKAQAAALASGVPCAGGIAALIHGPLWPSPAEERMLRGFGAEAVAMALGPELAVCAWLGLEATALLLLGARWGKPQLDFCRTLLGRL